MNNEHFFKLVTEMRTLQKRYFATRDKTTLQRSKDVESRIDKIIEEKLSNQINLF